MEQKDVLEIKEEAVVEQKKNAFLVFLKKVGNGLKKLINLFDKNAKNRTTKKNTMLEWKKDGWKAAICLAPALIILSIFTFYPIIKTFIVAFFPDYNYQLTIEQGAFGDFGFGSFTTVLNDPLFWRAMGNTCLMLLISVPLSIAVSLLFSVLLNSIKKLQGFFQTIFFLPYVTNGIAFGLVFATIFSPMDYGLINSLIGQTIAWTGTAAQIPYWAGLLVIIVYTIWNGLAFKILVFLGGLQGIDKQYYQAAQIDETPKWRVFLRITVPLLSPMIMYIAITSTIGAFKSYSSIVGIFGEAMGNAQDHTFITVVGYIYEYFNVIKTIPDTGALSIASAAAVILFIIILIVTFFQLLVNSKKVHY